MAGADQIRLVGVRVDAVHGVYPEEKLRPQPFLIDLTATLRRRSDVDRLSATVDYSALVSAIVAVVQERSVDLIETLAQRIADSVLAFPGIAEVEVSVHKPEAPLPVPVSDVSVTIIRRKQDE